MSPSMHLLPPFPHMCIHNHPAEPMHSTPDHSPATLTALSHDQIVPTLVFNGKVDLGYHDKDSALGGRDDGPGALDVGRVVARVVGGFDIAGVFSQLSSTVSVWQQQIIRLRWDYRENE